MAEATEAGRDGEAAVLAGLDRLGSLLSAKDIAFVDEFAASADVRLIGSEAGEIAEGRVAIEALVRKLYALPVSLGWEWARRSASVAGTVAWVFAEGDVVIGRTGTVERVPYRMTGVLELDGGRWRWRQFHGSEPAAKAAAPRGPA